jgi:hypothetical protein
MKVTTTLMLLVTSAILAGCSSDDPPPPADLSHVKVFLTSTAYRPDFGGLANADATCTTAANLQGSTGNWTAWLSDNGGSAGAPDRNAVDRIFDSGGKPYKTLDGIIVASNLADLTDGTLDRPINIDEAGNKVTIELEVWSATAANGKYSGAGTCVNWAITDPGNNAAIGVGGETDATWTIEGGGHGCDTGYNRLYCFADFVSQ